MALPSRAVRMLSSAPRVSVTLLITLLFFPWRNAEGETPNTGIAWQEWSEDYFAAAQREKKLLILNLEAVWCHWCHVMEEKTYSRPEIRKIIGESFIALRADQDARPDLSARFRDWGWPATIIFRADGTELRKMAGFVEPEALLATLKSVVANPVPEPGESTADGSVTASATGIPAVVTAVDEQILPHELRAELGRRHETSLDRNAGGLRTTHRYLEPDAVEYALTRAAAGNEEERRWVNLTLQQSIKLIDPVWGGLYQYSTRSGWTYPHFEKIMSSQSVGMRLYSFAYTLLNDETFKRAAIDIQRYLTSLLMDSQGAFYTSQDADLKRGEHSREYFSLGDAERRKRGIPAIDKHLYARENGLAISGLTALYAATGDRVYRDQAIRAANWVVENRALPGGGFRHDAIDRAGPYLGDSLAMATAMLRIYGVSGERLWLQRAEETARFIAREFIDGAPDSAVGIYSSAIARKGLLRPVRTLPENLEAARLYNMLSHYTGNAEYKGVARSAMRFAAQPSIALRSINESGILSAGQELSEDPLHITIVGYKDDPAAQALFDAGLRYPVTYKRVEWWDTREGPLPNPDVQYPQMQKAAAFICTNRRCSLPIFTPQGIPDTIKLFQTKGGGAMER